MKYTKNLKEKKMQLENTEPLEFLWNWVGSKCLIMFHLMNRNSVDQWKD